MIQYKLQKNAFGDVSSVGVVGQNISIPFDPANTDYENFKYQINHDEATLEDADGNVMSSDEAKAYVATLP
jgi:hypothetical protein